MGKSNFLLVDLNETKTKQLAETITSDTSRKILNHLAEKDDTEANISKDLNLPISTVHYHLQKLLEAKLVVVEEFHYSKKGREVNHYKLANKYIIIAPKNTAKTAGLKQKLRSILPAALAALGISAIIKWLQTTSLSNPVAAESMAMVAQDMALEESAGIAARSAAQLAEPTMEVAKVTAQQPDLALWFLLGSMSSLALYLIIVMVRDYWKNRKVVKS